MIGWAGITDKTYFDSSINGYQNDNPYTRNPIYSYPNLGPCWKRALGIFLYCKLERASQRKLLPPRYPANQSYKIADKSPHPHHLSSTVSFWILPCRHHSNLHKCIHTPQVFFCRYNRERKLDQESNNQRYQLRYVIYAKWGICNSFMLVLTRGVHKSVLFFIKKNINQLYRLIKSKSQIKPCKVGFCWFW